MCAQPGQVKVLAARCHDKDPSVRTLSIVLATQIDVDALVGRRAGVGEALLALAQVVKGVLYSSMCSCGCHANVR